MKRLVTLIVTPLLCRDKGASLSLGIDLPPKSQSTLHKLTLKRNSLIGDLSNYCIQNFECYDLPRAKDFIRTYTCEFFDILREAYGGLAFYREDEVADEAIAIAVACWNNFNAHPNGEFWIDTLRVTIIQYLGRNFRKEQTSEVSQVQTLPRLSLGKQANAYAASGVDMASASPLMKMAADAAARGSQVQPQRAASESKSGAPTQAPPDSSEAERRANLLAEYKKATGNPSNRNIYEARNSGIYKPEFYQWKNGILPIDSKTTINFETFLRAKRRTIPRKPTS